MIENIKISVVIPIFNNIDTIERCLDSIYSQTYKNYECILADDCSDVDYSYLQEKYPLPNLERIIFICLQLQ